MISKIEVSQLNGLLIPEYCLLLIGVVSLIGDGVAEIYIVVSNRFKLIETRKVSNVSLICQKQVRLLWVEMKAGV